MSINGFKRKFCKEMRAVTYGKTWLIFDKDRIEFCETFKKYMTPFGNRTFADYHWFKCKNCQEIDNFLIENGVFDNNIKHIDVLECDGCGEFCKTTRVMESGKYRYYCDICWIKYKENQEAFTQEHYK